MAENDATEHTRAIAMDARIGIIGAGRLGSSLAGAMSDAGYRIDGLFTRRPEHREWLASRFRSATVHDDPQAAVDRAEVVFLTVSDAAIQQAAAGIRWHPGQSVVHCSGAAPVSYLAAAASAGAATGGFHPLQTFPTPEASDSFTGITFGIEAADGTLEPWLHSLARDLGGNPMRITAEQRPAYHTAAVMACGLLAGLTGLAAEVWASSGGISREEAVSSLAPLVKSTANWIGLKGLPDALTGPYVRGDVATVRTHVDATSAVSGEMGAAYSAIALAALHIAAEQGGLTPETERLITEILANTLLESCENIGHA